MCVYVCTRVCMRTRTRALWTVSVGVPELLGCRCARLRVCVCVRARTVCLGPRVCVVCVHSGPAASPCVGSRCLGSTCFPTHVLPLPLPPASLGVCSLFFVVFTSPSHLPYWAVHRKALGGVGWGGDGAAPLFLFVCVRCYLTALPVPTGLSLSLVFVRYKQ